MGRKEIRLEKETLAALYDKYQNAKKVGSVLGCSDRTVRKYLKRFGYKIPRGGNRFQPHPHYGCVIKWVRENREIKLPRSIKKITALTGCTSDSVRTYLYRRRKEVKDFIGKVEDLRKTDLILVNTLGRLIPAKYFLNYNISFNKYSFNIKISASIKGTSRRQIFRFSFIKFRKLFYRFNGKSTKG